MQRCDTSDAEVQSCKDLPYHHRWSVNAY